MENLPTPQLPEPVFSDDLKKRKDQRKKERNKINKKVKYLDQLFNKQFLSKYFNEK